MSVPHFGWPPAPPTEILARRHADNFHYILYHQEPGRAEAEYDADPEGLLRMLYASPEAQRAPPTITDPKRQAGGFIGRWGRPRELPEWLDRADLEVYLDAFRNSGFRGGVNYYRNLDRNWRLMQERDPVVTIPACFIAGARDLVLGGRDEASVRARMEPLVPQLQGVEWIDGAGHWIQQELM